MPLTNAEATLGSAVVGGASGLIGSMITAYANKKENERTFERQRQLAREEYDNYLNYSRVAGATPASIAQGITHAGAASIPTVSTGGNPAPDFGQSIAAGVGSLAAQRQAGASEVQAGAESDYKNMLIKWEPVKFYNDAFAAHAKAFRDIYGVHLDKSQKLLFDEQAEEIRQLRPWKLEQAKQTFFNMQEEFKKIQSEIRFNNERTRTEKHLQSYYDSGSERNYSESFKSLQETYGVMFENSLRSIGFNPSKNIWQNMLRLAFDDPEAFEKRMDVFTQSLNILDTKLEEQIHPKYKEFGLGTFGFYLGRKLAAEKRQSKMASSSQIISLLGVLAKAGVL